MDTVTADRSALPAAARRPRTADPVPSAPAAFVRFALCGGGVGLASSGVLMALSGPVPFALANAVVTVASTVLATELHARFTFGRGRAGWRAHLESALTVVVCYLFTTAALLLLQAVCAAPGVLLRQSVYLAASALAGVGRFLVLRAVVFAGRGASATSAWRSDAAYISSGSSRRSSSARSSGTGRRRSARGRSGCPGTLSVASAGSSRSRTIRMSPRDVASRTPVMPTPSARRRVTGALSRSDSQAPNRSALGLTR
jgi:putative flippase GtrA